MCTDCNCGLSVPPAPPTTTPLTPGPHHGDPGPAADRLVLLGEQLLARNGTQAAANRRRFAAAGVRSINLLSSPGSGKTALLERMARDWTCRHPMAVVVGDLATDNDARRLRNAGLAAVQITTGQACHLEASMLNRALDQLDLEAIDWLMIENVGNLVCPAAYDLGEDLRLVLLSVTEGEDKPLKYPATFHSADVVVISKIDLAEACQFDLPHARRHIARVAPKARIVEVSARTGAGMDVLRSALEAALQAADGLVPVG